VNPETQEAMRDAAFATDIPDGWPHAVAGYYGGPRALNIWSRDDWKVFGRNRKLPIWVAGLAGKAEGVVAVSLLRELGVPPGCWTAVDMETRVDRTYVDAFGTVLANAGYRVWVYGSASTVFGNPGLDGFWVADYALRGPFMYPGGTGLEVRATQYATGQWDSSTVKQWTYDTGKWWR
jgi:hypothetical protein